MTVLALAIQTIHQHSQNHAGEQTQLLSIGIASEDGRRFHAVNAEAPMDKAMLCLPRQAIHELPIAENPIRLDPNDPDVMPLADIRAAFEAFLAATPSPQVWSVHGNVDHQVLTSVFEYHCDLLYPKGFPHWVSSVREQHARIVDSIGHRDPERLQQLESQGRTAYTVQESRKHHAFAQAHHTLRMLHRFESLAKDNGIDTSVRQPARLDWRPVWSVNTVEGAF